MPRSSTVRSTYWAWSCMGTILAPSRQSYFWSAENETRRTRAAGFERSLASSGRLLRRCLLRDLLRPGLLGGHLPRGRPGLRARGAAHRLGDQSRHDVGVDVGVRATVLD